MTTTTPLTEKEEEFPHICGSFSIGYEKGKSEKDKEFQSKIQALLNTIEEALQHDGKFDADGGLSQSRRIGFEEGLIFMRSQIKTHF